MIAENIAALRADIREVAVRSGRNPDEILLVAVSKTFDAGAIREALQAGVFDYGENYVQELLEKRAALSDPRLRWHFIGHLQTNKVKYVVDTVHLIHSLDSVRLAAELEKRGALSGRTIDVLVEVHTTDEATKYGVPPGETLELVRQVARFERVKVRGLMTMGPFSDDPNASRPSFRLLSELSRAIAAAGIPGVAMEHLSMGMTHDYRVAIEEGATILRIGTAVFGSRPGSRLTNA
jgi:hypothetical protein